MICAFGVKANEPDSVTDNKQLERYTFLIETGKAYVSGLMLVNENEDFINGSMINEFGVSAIDFTYSRKKRKVKLVNVAGFLNKWYIKMVMKEDIRFCLHTIYDIPYDKKNNYEVTRTGDTVSVFNCKRNIKYSFTPFNSNPANDTERESI